VIRRLFNKALRLVNRDAMSWSRGVPADTLHCEPSTVSYRSSLNPYVYRASLKSILRYEVKNILGRIRAIRDTRLYRRGILLDPGRSILVNSQGERKESRDVCIADIKRLTTARPHLTLVDQEIFYLGWKQGFDWGVRTAHKQADLQQHHSCTSLNSPAIPELTKCDPSNPLPSQE
jgi:hypothetical protein